MAHLMFGAEGRGHTHTPAGIKEAGGAMAPGVRYGFMMNGMPASVFGDNSTGRSGLFSVWDSHRYQANEKALLSAPSATSFIPLDERGKPFPPGTVYKHKGQLYRVNAQHAIRIVDTAQHRRNARYREMMDARVSEVAELVMASDHDAMSILGLDYKDYEALFGPGAATTGQPNVKAMTKTWDIPSDILGEDCRIRRLTLFPRDSERYVAGLSKLRALIANLMPALDDSGVSDEQLKRQKEDVYSEGLADDAVAAGPAGAADADA